ncbi:MAG: rhomboid family intramembrane serine protease [Chloroflexota bacterium]
MSSNPMSNTEFQPQVPHPQRYCPRCKQTPLEEAHYSGCEIDICPHCGGLWCEPEAWNREQLGAHPDFGTYQNAPSVERAPNIFTQGQSELECPECSRTLTSLMMGTPAICDVEQCDRCGGIWFDHKEWDHLEALEQWREERERIEAIPTWTNWFLQLLLSLPTEFNIRPRRVPYITIGLVLISVVAFLLQLSSTPEVWLPLGATPFHIERGTQLWTTITSLFLHGGWLHLLFNMYFLYILGDNIEDVLGPWRYLAFYLVCGISAALFYVLLNLGSEIPLIGASGAIAGIMAGYLLLFRQARLTFMFFFRQWKIPVWIWLGIWFAFNVFMTIVALGEGDSSGIAWSAHVGGFLAGLALIWPFEQRLIRNHSLLYVMRTYWQI